MASSADVPAVGVVVTARVCSSSMTPAYVFACVMERDSRILGGMTESAASKSARDPSTSKFASFCGS